MTSRESFLISGKELSLPRKQVLMELSFMELMATSLISSSETQSIQDLMIMVAHLRIAADYAWKFLTN